MDERLIGVIGAYTLGMTYLGGVIAAGLVWALPGAVLLAILSAGLGYVAQVAGYLQPSGIVALPAWAISVVAAVGGGAWLFTGG